MHRPHPRGRPLGQRGGHLGRTDGRALGGAQHADVQPGPARCVDEALAELTGGQHQPGSPAERELRRHDVVGRRAGAGQDGDVAGAGPSVQQVADPVEAGERVGPAVGLRRTRQRSPHLRQQRDRPRQQGQRPDRRDDGATAEAEHPPTQPGAVRGRCAQRHRVVLSHRRAEDARDGSAGRRLEGRAHAGTAAGSAARAADGVSRPVSPEARARCRSSTARPPGRRRTTAPRTGRSGRGACGTARSAVRPARAAAAS